MLIDVRLDEGLKLKGIAREIMNRVQRLRKKIGLQVTDQVAYEIQILTDEGGMLGTTLKVEKEFLCKGLKQDIYDKGIVQGKVLVEESQEVS